jgi:hypothetical protein
MATSPLTPIVFGGDLTTVWKSIYTVPTGTKAVGIDSVVFNNYSGNSQSFSVRLVQVGTATELNEIITDKNIRAKSNDLAPSMIGQGLVTGGEIQVKASANDAINLQITATVITE